MLKKAISRYKIARFFGLPFHICIKAFFSIKGTGVLK